MPADEKYLKKTWHLSCTVAESTLGALKRELEQLSKNAYNSHNEGGGGGYLLPRLAKRWKESNKRLCARAEGGRK